MNVVPLDSGKGSECLVSEMMSGLSQSVLTRRGVVPEPRNQKLQMRWIESFSFR